MFETNTRTFIAGAAITKDRLVTAGASNEVAHTPLTGTPDGVALNSAAVGEPVTVRLCNAGGTFEVETEGPVAAGGIAYARASGLADDNAAGSAIRFGKFLGAGSAAGAIVEVLPD